MAGKDLLSVADLSREDIRLLISNTVEMKAERRLSMLDGKILALLFEKPSLRTKVSFEVAMQQLGGHAVYLSPAEVGLGQRESAEALQTHQRSLEARIARGTEDSRRE